ncbi:MAG: glycosyltransferase family 2 protein [Nitrospirae bacterium]|nr:glycosyltransferase family 2 protein [Nitrospirota bacterium]
MNDFPSVYVIVLTWNQRGLCLETVASVLASDYPNMRVVVVDNASEDGTPDAVRQSFPSVHLIVNPENLMYAGGNNVGIDWAMTEGADYVLLLNNDVVVDPAMVTRLVVAAEAGGAGMAGPMMYYYPPRGEGRELIWYAGGLVSYWMGRTAHRGIRKVDTGQYRGAEDTYYISGCALLVHSDVIKDVGLLDTSYVIYSEDADWCVRASKAGYRLLFVPEARLWHKVSASSGGGITPFKVYHRVRSGIKFFARHGRPWHWLTMPFFMAGYAVWFLLRKLASGNTGDVWSVVRGLFTPKRG